VKRIDRIPVNKPMISWVSQQRLVQGEVLLYLLMAWHALEEKAQTHSSLKLTEM